MPRRFATTLLLLSLAAAAAPAVAAPAAKPAAAKASGGVNDDVRCMLTMVAFANLNKDHPQAGQIGVLFFAGRISARSPGLDLAAAVKTQAATLGPQQLQAELQRCGPMVDLATRHVQAAINGLRPAGAPPAAAPAPAPAPGPAPAPAPATPK